MPDNNNKNEVSVSDDDPTLELEPLNLEELTGFEITDDEPVELTGANGDAVVQAHPDKADTAVLDTAEIDELRDELKYRLELNCILQLGNEQLRERSDTLQEQVTRLMETVDSLKRDLEQSRGNAETAREDRDDTIASLRLKNHELSNLATELDQELDAAKAAAEQNALRRVEKKSGQSRPNRPIRLNGSVDRFVLTAASDNNLNGWLLDSQTMTIGSSPECDIHLANRFVSKKHARLQVTPKGCVIEDLNSTNGTFINARRVRKRTVRVGDLIKIGKTRFKLEKQSADQVARDQKDFDAMLCTGEK